MAVAGFRFEEKRSLKPWEKIDPILGFMIAVELILFIWVVAGLL